MDNSNIVFLINDEARAIAAVYEPNAKPTVFKTLDQSIKVDDFLVVQSDTRHGITTVQVVEVDVDMNFDTAFPTKWVISKIDMQSFNRVLEMEKEAIAAVNSAERKRKKDALRAALFADHEDKIRTLQLASDKGGDVTE